MALSFRQDYNVPESPGCERPWVAVCWCHKPRIGMLALAAVSMHEQHPDEIYPPHLALFVGDRPEDEQCATNAGISFLWAHEWRQMPFTITV